MPATSPTILDQIGAEKTKVSERLARLDTERTTVTARLTDLETAEGVLAPAQNDPPRQKNHIACRGKAPNRQPRPGTAAKNSRQQVRGTQTQRTEPGRARPGLGYRQNPTGTLQGVPQRSPEPCRYRGAAPSPRRTDPGA